MSVIISKVDYRDLKQGDAMRFLMNSYAIDPMGGGKPLDDYVLENLLTELASIPHAFSVLCIVNGQPAGLINCFELFSTFSCKPLVNIHDVIVLKEYRGKGLSHQMLKLVEEIAIEKGCCKLTLEVLSENKVAKSSYTKFGFSSYQLDPQAGQALFWEKCL